MQRNSAFGFKDFYLRRVLRIYPAYLLALACYCVARKLTPSYPVSLHNFVLHLLMVFNTSNIREFLGINAAFWTLAIEAQFYFLLPILSWITFRGLGRRPRAAMFGTALFFVILGIFWRAMEVAGSASPTANEMTVRFHQVFSFLDWFGFGMVVAAVDVTLASGRRLRGVESAWLFLLGGILIVGANSWGTERHTLPGVTGGDSAFLWGSPIPLCFGLALMLFAVIRSEGGISSFLAWRPLAFLGKISYSIYLFHILVQLVMFRFVPFGKMMNYFLESLLAGLLSLFLTIPVAMASFHLAEAPGLRLAERFKKNRAGPTPLE
jgi:peptidoglycan/LPS O-acetylase OafA/YrhL